MATIKWETADNMMNIVAFVAMRAGIEHGEQIDLEAIKEFARNTFQEYCDTVGITEVEDTDEENTEDFDDEEWDEDEEGGYFNSDYEDEDDNCQYSITCKGDFIARAVETGNFSFEEACSIADVLFGE